MHIISKKVSFDSAHFLRGYEGKCKNVHGHTYFVEVMLCSEKLNELGMVVDFGDVKKAIQEEIIEKYDHQLLNDVPPFDIINPTAENMARQFFDVLKLALPDCRVIQVNVWETPSCKASYSDAYDMLKQMGDSAKNLLKLAELMKEVVNEK